MSMTSLANHFLIAMPALMDPNFHRSVTYICEHNEHGAMGIVINQPLDIELGEVLQHMEIPTKQDDIAHQIVHVGGPVQQERGFVLHRPAGDWHSMLQVGNDMAVTTSRDILEAISVGEGPSETFVALGYAGWAPGQLEHEIAENSWLSGPADEQIIFRLPFEDRWQAAVELLGVDIQNLSDEVGHA
jgi:putative transcriptional regulator